MIWRAKTNAGKRARSRRRGAVLRPRLHAHLPRMRPSVSDNYRHKWFTRLRAFLARSKRGRFEGRARTRRGRASLVRAPRRRDGNRRVQTRVLDRFLARCGAHVPVRGTRSKELIPASRLVKSNRLSGVSCLCEPIRFPSLPPLSKHSLTHVAL